MNQTLKKNLVIITEGYPYLGQEQFWYNEFIELSKQYNTLIFFPLSKGTEMVKNLPKNVIIRHDFQNLISTNKNILLKNIPLLLNCIFTELRHDKKGI